MTRRWFGSTRHSSTPTRALASLLRAAGSTEDIEVVFELAERYAGRFALDFEYEEWASGFRNDLHARYLETIERAILGLTKSGDYAGGSPRPPRFEVDPTADNVEEPPFGSIAAMGSFAAAAERYGR